MHQTVAKYDAIGNDIELMYRILSEKYKCFVYAINRFNKQVEYTEKEDLPALLEDAETTVIYHHSVYWEEGFGLVKKAKGKVVFRYHNITPEGFFEDYDSFAYHQCRAGRDQTAELQSEFPEALWLVDSPYNAEDLTKVNPQRIGICPPFNKIGEWGIKKPDEKILKELVESSDLNILFVGRVAPNKGHLMLLETVRYYCAAYGSDIKLRIVGKFDEALSGYNDLIRQTISEYGLEDAVEFIGEIDDNKLISYYLGSDFFVCCSEHEGFCVPIVEAQRFGLPTISLNMCAVPDTVGEGGMILSKDPRLFAAALKVLKDNRDMRDHLRKKGFDNYNGRYTFERIQELFLSEMNRLLGTEI